MMPDGTQDASSTNEAAAAFGRWPVSAKRDIVYRTSNGMNLLADLYLPKGLDGIPFVVAVHGGGWRVGDRLLYQHWGPYLASHGIAVFSVDYRLASANTKAFPDALEDVQASMAFLLERHHELGLDPDRMGIIGDSAGAQLAALAALGQHNEPRGRDKAHTLRLCMGVYGVYDLVAQWDHDKTARPTDSLTEPYLGATPADNIDFYRQASPLNNVGRRNGSLPFLLVYGDDDPVVDPVKQTLAFERSLRQAGFPVRTIGVQGVGHFWFSDPLDQPGSPAGGIATKVLAFLEEGLCAPRSATAPGAGRVTAVWQKIGS